MSHNLIRPARDLDSLVHRKVYKRKGKAFNYRTSKRFMWLLDRMRRIKKRRVLMSCDDDAISVTLEGPTESQLTVAPTLQIALCVAAVRCCSLGLFPHDLGKRLKVKV